MSDWANITEYVLLGILSHLSTSDISRCSLVCRRWLWVARSDGLWRLKIREKLSSLATRCLSPGTSTWREEHRRMVEQVPRYPSSLTSCHHYGGVTDITFSSDGEMMATCGDDAKLVVWRMGDIVLEKDLNKKLGWVCATRVQFNPSGSLLMVSGALKMNIHKSRLGEILVVRCRGEEAGDVTSRISLKPYETVGCWYNNSYLVSSDYEWLAHLVSTNKFWMNKVDYSLDSDPSLACMRQLYKLYNCSGSAIRDIKVVREGSYNDSSYLSLVEQHCLHLVVVSPHQDCPAIPPSMDNRKIDQTWDKQFVIDWEDNPLVDEEDYDQELCPIEFSEQYFLDREDDFENGRDEDDWLWEDETFCEDEDEFQWEYFRSEGVEEEREEIVEDKEVGAEVLNEKDKLLIFTTGLRCSAPHQIGVKLMSKIKFKKKLHIPPDMKAFIQEQEEARRIARDQLVGRLEVEVTPWNDYREVAQMFDVVDVIFDFSGIITGYAVSPDSRYLYVNMRPWASNVVITDPYSPPPVAYCVERVVIDLATMEVVGRSHPRQRIFIPFEHCYPTPVQVTRHYATTITRDRGVIMDTHSGVTLACLPHEGVSGCVTNPHNSSQAVTAAEDGTLQYWNCKAK